MAARGRGHSPFRAWAEESLVVEEKRGFIEDQIAHLLFNAPDRPLLVGKRDEEGRVLLTSEGELSPVTVAREPERVQPVLRRADEDRKGRSHEQGGTS